MLVLHARYVHWDILLQLKYLRYLLGNGIEYELISNCINPQSRYSIRNILRKIDQNSSTLI